MALIRRVARFSQFGKQASAMYSTLSKKQSSRSFAPAKAPSSMRAMDFGRITVSAGQSAKAFSASTVTA